MLALKIIATVFLVISFITAFLKNIRVCDGEDKPVIFFTIYSWLWKSLVIVAIWLS